MPNAEFEWKIIQNQHYLFIVSLYNNNPLFALLFKLNLKNTFKFYQIN
jgi:hypothetical protein